MSTPQRQRNLVAAFKARRDALVADVQSTTDAMTRCQKAAQRGDFQLGNKERFDGLAVRRAALVKDLADLDTRAQQRIDQAGAA